MVAPEQVPPEPSPLKLVRDLKKNLARARTALNRARNAEAISIIRELEETADELVKIVYADRLADEPDIRTGMLIREAERLMNRTNSLPQSDDR